MNNFSKRLIGRNRVKHIACAIAAAVSVSALADTALPKAYNMVVIEDQAFGKAIKSGNHQRAIKRLERSHLGNSKRFLVNNNLCVAYVMANQFDDARTHCDRAVASRAHVARANGFWQNGEQDWAIALSNRGVFRALTGDHLGARSDFSSAVELQAGLTQPAGNLTRLKSKYPETLTALDPQ